jgi:hypothetical protein
MASAIRVDCYLYAPHEIPTWLPIVVALRHAGADARYVLEPPGRNLARGSRSDASQGWRDDKVRGTADLVDDETYARLRAGLEAVGEVPLDRLRPRASAITSAGARWLTPWSGARIRCMYGVGLVQGAWGHGPVNHGFDLVLVPGPFSRREILAADPTVPVAEVGYPKWIASRRGELTRLGARDALGLDPSATVVLWLPTWADHSSLDRYQDAFEQLSHRHLVVVKPHSNSIRFEQARLEHLRSLPVDRLRVVDVTADLATLVTAADVVVSDVRSGAVTEALLGDRPVVAFDDPSPTPDHLHPLGEGALERCGDPAQLGRTVELALEDPRRDGRRALVEDLFGPASGDDPERAAAAVLDVSRRVGHPLRRRVSAPAWTAAYRLSRRMGR